MNTGTRRFILRLAVGLLMFLIGVGAAWAFGSFNPFQSSSGEGYYKYRHYRNYRNQDVTPEPAFVYPRYRKHECDAKRALDKLPSAPLADAPMPPSPPSTVR